MCSTQTVYSSKGGDTEIESPPLGLHLPDDEKRVKVVDLCEGSRSLFLQGGPPPVDVAPAPHQRCHRFGRLHLGHFALGRGLGQWRHRLLLLGGSRGVTLCVTDSCC